MHCGGKKINLYTGTVSPFQDKLEEDFRINGERFILPG
jgi:hypothetical protein